MTINNLIQRGVLPVNISAASPVNYLTSAAYTTVESNSFDAGTASDRILIYWILSASGSDPSNVTYNGVGMSLITKLTVSIWHASLWGLASPASGTNTLAITSTFGTDASQITVFENCAGWDIIFSTDEQTGADSNDVSTSIDSSSSNHMIFNGYYGSDGSVHAPQSGQTVAEAYSTGDGVLESAYKQGTGGTDTLAYSRDFFSDREEILLKMIPV